jgi:hypothetical protein
MTNERGEFTLPDASAVRQLQLLRIGFRPREVAVTISAPGARLDLTMVALPTLLEPVRVTSTAQCANRSNAAEAWGLLDQARAALLATVAAREANPAKLKLLAFERTMDGNTDHITEQRVRVDSATGAMISFGASRDAATLVERGFVTDSTGWQTYYGPDAEVMLADEFSRGYCMSIVRASGALSRKLIGLGFAPATQRRGRIDIAGTLWIDTVARALDRIEFRYLGLPAVVDGFSPRGSVYFRSMENGVVLIDRWTLRVVGSADTLLGDEKAMRLRRGFVIREVGGELAHATWPDGKEWQARLGTLDVTVVDANGTAIPNTIVGLRRTDYHATTDARGRARIIDLVPGPYAAVERDTVLATVGISLPAGLGSAFVAARDSTAYVQFVAPIVEEFIGETCREEGGGRDDRSAWVVGRATSADGQPISGVRWTLSRSVGNTWKTVASGGITGASGHFYLCRGLRIGETVRIEARGKNGAEQVAIRRLNGDITAVPMLLMSGAVAGAVGARDVRSPTKGVLTGIVSDSVTGSSVPGARVWLLATSFQATTDSAGRFTMSGVPGGDYTVDVRTWTLDSLGVTSQSSFTFVDSASIHVHVPSPGTITAAMCRSSGRAAGDNAGPHGVIVGEVRSPSDSGATARARARVVAEWRDRRLEARTDDRGRFRICGIPLDTDVRLRALGDAAAAAPIEIRVPAQATFARAELLLDRPIQVVQAGTVPDSAPGRSDRSTARGGRRELVGAVRDVKGRPIEDATVSVHSEVARTDATGTFQLWTADVDTATIQVRRLGYSPVDALLKAHGRQWDTVVVEMDRGGVLLRAVNINEMANRRAIGLRDFEKRRAIGLGQFVTRAEIEAKATNRLSELLRTKRGVRVVRSRTGINGIRFALHASDRLGCEPAMWLDGQRVPGLEIDEILPYDIEAIELYETFAATPTEFTTGVSSTCGTIVIWTRVPPPPKR